MIIINKYLVRKGYKGFAFYPFIILRKKEYNTPQVINHERIHLRQQLEMFIVFFYIWYFIEYVVRRIQFGNWRTAYYNISFESEAFLNDNNLKYLKKRKLYAWSNFLKVYKKLK